MSDQTPSRQPNDKSWSGIIGAHGGYRELKSYQGAEIIYDATVAFCERFIDKKSRTHDQMVQAVRSGKQNIAEGGFTERLYRIRREQRGG